MNKVEQAIEIIMYDKGLEWCERCQKWISIEAFHQHLNSEQHERG